MKRIMLPVLLFGLLLAGCDETDVIDVTANTTVQQVNDEKNSTNSKQLIILALGDSLTEGLGVAKNKNYPAVLEDALQSRGFDVKVVNSGLSGETSSGLKSRLDWVLQLNPDLTILNIGANDAMRGLPLELTQTNIENIIERIQASNSQVILAGMQIYDNLGQDYVVRFKDMYLAIAQKKELLMIPFFLDHVAGNPELNQDDMIHPNATGYEIIVEKNLLPVVIPVMEKLTQIEIQP